jgi:hypothetical protein
MQCFNAMRSRLLDCAWLDGSHAGGAASQKMQQEQDQADDEDNVDQPGRHMKREKSE